PARVTARVVNLSPKTPNQKSKPKPQPAKPINRRVHFAAAAVLAVALVLLGLSLSHLAAEIALVTGAGPSDGWAMAIGIDLGFVALELAVLVAPADKRSAVARYAAPAITGTLAISAAMNGFVRGACGRLIDLSGRRARRHDPGDDLRAGQNGRRALD